MFVTFEGLDFCGKSTQAQKLLERLQQNHRSEPHRWPPALLIREPGGTALSERLRGILLDRESVGMTDLTELMLFSASRAQVVTEVIRPALERGDIVICDRYHDSTMAYQGYGRGLNLRDIRQVNAIATGGLDPELTFLVEVTIAEMIRRKKEAQSSSDRMEASGRAFYERVQNGYVVMASAEPDRFARINGMESVEHIQEEVWRILMRRLEVSEQSVAGDHDE